MPTSQCTGSLWNSETFFTPPPPELLGAWEVYTRVRRDGNPAGRTEIERTDTQQGLTNDTFNGASEPRMGRPDGDLLPKPRHSPGFPSRSRGRTCAGEAARRIDRTLTQELPAESLTASISPVPDVVSKSGVGARSQVDDETYLRRVSFDLIGQLPTPEEVTLFVLDPAKDKREKLVDRLLADERFGENWARYWRDVVLYRRSDERALIATDSVTSYLTAELNKGTGWDEIARACISANGNLTEDGSTALIASQWGEVPETAAEVSRVFLGVQIQCAQCHDHPTDRWKRQQFHELAAFFARIAVRPIKVDGKRRGFEVTSTDEGFKDRPPAAQAKIKAKAKGKNRRFEHFMPDLENPTAEGTLMEPVFFLTGQKLPVGTSDEDRRKTLGDWITSAENPWFARAFVNRVWGELVGVGFYEPIDDLGPDRTCGAQRRWICWRTSSSSTITT